MVKNVNKDINIRIKDICDNIFDGNVSKMSKTIDVSRTTLVSIIGEQNSNPGSEILRKIIEHCPVEINSQWLLTGVGNMIHTDSVISLTEGIPYYDEMFECGFDELIAPSSESPDYYINVPGYEKASLWCNASGDSMDPEIKNGDIIALQEIQDPTFLPYGDIYAFITTNGMRTIKRLGRSDVENCYRLIPTNKDYHEQDIPKKMIQKAYRVLGAIKSL